MSRFLLLFVGVSLFIGIASAFCNTAGGACTTCTGTCSNQLPCTTVCGATSLWVGSGSWSCSNGANKVCSGSYVCPDSTYNCKDGAGFEGCESNVVCCTGASGTDHSACPAVTSNAATVTGSTCTDGACAPACATGKGNCDDDYFNGCETDVNTATNCGACGTTCDPTSNAATVQTSACTSGACVLTCVADKYDCNRIAADGCESDIKCCGLVGAANTDPSTCNTLAWDNVNAYSCSSGKCSIGSCTAFVPQTGSQETGFNFQNCDGINTNGCESEGQCCTGGTPGTTSTSCALSNATGYSCTADGACTYSGCAAGFFDCDGYTGNGCGSTIPCCAAGGVSTGCSIVEATDTIDTYKCDGFGRCDIDACLTPTLIGNCDGNAANGCETDLSQGTHCGSCTESCTGVADPVLHITASSCNSDGAPTPTYSCSVTCETGWNDCNRLAADGCETQVPCCEKASDAATTYTVFTNCATNIGLTSTVTFTNQDSIDAYACLNGACAVGTCKANRGFDCDKDVTDGCESSEACCLDVGGSYDTSACSFDNVAASGYTCSNNLCAIKADGCLAEYNNCDGNRLNGCETHGPCCVGGSAAGCSLPNALTYYCNEFGACLPDSCVAGTEDCNGEGIDGCEGSANDANNCGGCGNKCSNINVNYPTASGTTERSTGWTCVSSLCTPTCASGYNECDGNLIVRCETFGACPVPASPTLPSEQPLPPAPNNTVPVVGPAPVDPSVPIPSPQPQPPAPSPQGGVNTSPQQQTPSPQTPEEVVTAASSLVPALVLAALAAALAF